MTAVHDFHSFMKSLRQDMAHDYERITSRSKEDPGTAGDQGEESWATLLRQWLPSNYPIVTKGRLLFSDGSSSPQVDIVILRPSYPRALQDKKYYFAGGVVAAFECKLNLRKRDIGKVFRNSALIKRKMQSDNATVYDDLFRPPFYGLLAHSSEWKTTPTSRLHESLRNHAERAARHPNELPDVACIADAGFAYASKRVVLRRYAEDADVAELDELGLESGVSVMYAFSKQETAEDFPGKAMDQLASLIFSITRNLAFDDASLRPWVDHLSNLGFFGGIALPLFCDARQVLSAETMSKIRARGFESQNWSRWQTSVP